MAHYLHRAFRHDPAVHILHGLRLQDEAQAEWDGSAGVCQIDHLLVHRLGMFIVESKSVTGEVRVRADSSAGDEWSRAYRGRETGMPSPIRQAQRQGDFLRAYLRRHDDHLLGRMPVGLRAFSKAVRGTDQRGFREMPIQIVIAVSDGGTIRRLDGWKEPTKPFRVFVTKADLVPSKVTEELHRHRKGLNLLTPGEYGLWRMAEDEALRVAEFLAARHVERRDHPTPMPRPTGSTPVRAANSGDRAKARLTTCKYCHSVDLTANSGKFGYYWKCATCGRTTSMTAICSACGAKRLGDAGPKIRKQGASYFRDCPACGASERIWKES